MRAHELEAFKALDDDGIFASIFDGVREELSAQWAKENDPALREELWQRQRALRDVKRAFNRIGGLDA